MLGWVSFFTDLASAMVNPVLPIFVVTLLHQGMDKLGVIVALATFVSYALRLVSGYIADRYGIVKPLVVGGYALSALSKPLLGITHVWQSVAALKSLERLGKGLRSAPKDALIAAYGKQKRQGRTFGFHKTMDIAGELGGTLLLFWLLRYLGDSETVIRGIFFATIVPGMIGLVIVAFFVKDAPAKERASVRFVLTSRDKRTLLGLLPYFLFLFFMFNDAFFTMEAKTIGIATAIIPLLFVVSTGTQTATSYVLGLGVDRFGPARVTALGYGSGVAAQFLLWLQLPTATWFAYAFLGLFTVATLNANRAMIAETADNRGSVYGVFYAGVALFGAMGAGIGGWIWERFGMHMALDFALSGTIAVGMFFIMLQGVRR